MEVNEGAALASSHPAADPFHSLDPLSPAISAPFSPQMGLFRSLSVGNFGPQPPPLHRTYSISKMDDVCGMVPRYSYLYYYPRYRTHYPSYQYNSCRVYTSFYNRHYSNWPEHHFNYPFSTSGYKPLSFYGSYTYSPYRAYNSPSGYYYGWYNGITGY